MINFEPAKFHFTDSIVCVEPVKENGVVYGVENGREIQKGEDCDRPFSHIKENIVLNIKEGNFS